MTHPAEEFGTPEPATSPEVGPIPTVEPPARAEFAVSSIELFDRLGRGCGRTQQVSGNLISVAAWMRSQADQLDPPPPPKPSLHRPGYRGGDLPSTAELAAKLANACPECRCGAAYHGNNRPGCTRHPDCTRTAADLTTNQPKENTP